MSPLVGQILLVVTACVLLMITSIYLLKPCAFSSEVMDEFNHPIKISFFPAFSISLLLIATATLELSPGLSRHLWISGAIIHLLLTLHVMTQWIQFTRFKVQHSTPAWFIPVGNIVAPIAGVQHGYTKPAGFSLASVCLLAGTENTDLQPGAVSRPLA